MPTLLPLLVGLLFASSLATANEPCEHLLTEADTIVAQRDRDALAGVARGEALLAELPDGQGGCPVAAAMVQAAVGSNLHILGRNAEALARFRAALDLLAGTDAGAAQWATVHRGAGLALADSEDYTGALDAYLASLDHSQRADDALEAAKTAGNIGNLYNNLGELDASQRYHEQALDGFREAEHLPGIAGSLINLGSVAAKRALAAERAGDEEGARAENRRLRDLNDEALTLFTQLGNERGIAYAASNVGLALDRLGDPAAALPFHERALAIRAAVGDLHGEIYSRVTLAGSALTMRQPARAAAHLDAAEALLPDNATEVGLRLEIVRKRVAVAEARGDFREALAQQREVTRLQDAQAAQGHAERVAEIQARFDTDSQAREIELLRSAGEIQALQLQRQRLVLGVVALAGLLLALLAAVTYRRLTVGRRVARELERAAGTDAVTGLANRRAMLERLQEALAHSRETGQPLTLVMADVDHFKAINDRHGHDAGDAVLVAIGERLAATLRSQDTLARWGGEEFLLLLPATGLTAGHAIAERLRKAISATPFTVAGEAVMLTITQGVATARPGMSAQSLIKAADQALYAGKRRGRDQVVAVSTG
ncbi:MAG: diguanylate cyclase [Xanthomonadales bacterium]|nr:diguanylate cyclase [Xanthomonadales bacterium]